MKAVRIHQYGHADELRYEDAPVPETASDDLLVRVVAASVNPLDWKVREGHLQQMIPYPMPLTLGWDVSGIVESIGTDVTGFKVGDAIFSRPDVKRNGSYAEYVAVRESEAALKPRTISHVESAALPLAGITAWECLFTVGKLERDQRVLIHAGAGGVGSLAVQLARSQGAHVIATASAANMALVSALGAHEVIDYRAERFWDVVGDLDVVIDTVGGETQEMSWSLLKPDGILVSIISPPSQERAQTLGVRAAFVFVEPNATILAQLSERVDAGTLRPVIGAEFALEAVANAHAYSETGHPVGKIVLYVGQP
jgi:NADPH:quinone reductase-like Zn-dependent oxidoreductase